MKFHRIDENTINCVISQEDLASHGLQIEDLFEKRRKPWNSSM